MATLPTLSVRHQPLHQPLHGAATILQARARYKHSPRTAGYCHLAGQRHRPQRRDPQRQCCRHPPTPPPGSEIWTSTPITARLRQIPGQHGQHQRGGCEQCHHQWLPLEPSTISSCWAPTAWERTWARMLPLPLRLRPQSPLWRIAVPLPAARNLTAASIPTAPTPPGGLNTVSTPITPAASRPRAWSALPTPLRWA